MAPMAVPMSPNSPASPLTPDDAQPQKAVLPRRARPASTPSSDHSAVGTPAPPPPPPTQQHPPPHPATTVSSASAPVTNPALTTGTTAASSAVPSPPELDDDAASTSGGGGGGGGDGEGSSSLAVAAAAAAVMGPTSAPSGRRTGPSSSTLASDRDRLAATAPPTAAPTPVTGLGKMAAAASAGKKRGGELVPAGQPAAGEEDHPLSDRSLAARDYHTLHAMQHLFHLPNRWKLLRPLGQGAYGLVISVQDDLSGEPVAVKCITRVFDKPILTKRALREITLLRHFGEHENLTGLIDLDNVWNGYNEIYLYMEPMEADLHQIVRSGQPLSNLHIQFFLYQLLRGMKYIHSANVIHRDLKPGNLLVNSDCELKICDFGLARGFAPVTGETPQNDDLKMTEYVATRWYRAPEIMLSNRRYTTAIDVWSIGCILGELLALKPMFKGKDYVDQLNLILGVLGTPDDATLATMSSEKARAYLRTLPHSDTVPFDQVLPGADPEALDLLGKLLAFDPTKRVDVVTALEHPYVGAYHDPADEPECEVFDKWEEVEKLQTTDELREALTREITEYRAEVRGAAAEEYEEGEYDYEVEEIEDGGEGSAAGALTSEPVSTDVSARHSVDEGSSHRDYQGLEVVVLRGRLGLAAGGLPPSPSPCTLSPDHIRSKLGKMAQAGRSPTLSPRKSLPLTAASPAHEHARSQSRSRSRDVSPYTPATPHTGVSTISEESFGHSAGAHHAHGQHGQSATTGRRSRRSSSTASLKRRSMSFLFGGGFGGIGMTSMTTGSASKATGGGDSAMTVSSAEYTASSSTMAGRRSRAPSGVGAPGDIGSLRPLIRRLSTANLDDLHRAATDSEPLITHSPSNRSGAAHGGGHGDDQDGDGEDGALSMSMRRRGSSRAGRTRPAAAAVPVVVQA